MRKLISKKTVVFLSLVLTLALLISPMLFSADAADTPGTVRTQIVNLDTEW